ncbi:transcription termination/antitermination factor NusG, partial [Alistipes sp. OttesenSCG-928-B03]|nr:transcription termination/antitermination factor NusG [Alistipes sp. OttesenSCG-928-B03]
MSEKEQKQWYVVRAIGGKEKKVKEYIELEIKHRGLQDYISQVLIPTEKVFTVRNGKKVSKEKVSYPGYVLVEA